MDAGAHYSLTKAWPSEYLQAGYLVRKIWRRLVIDPLPCDTLPKNQMKPAILEDMLINA
jgi:hypothetical protein